MVAMASEPTSSVVPMLLDSAQRFTEDLVKTVRSLVQQEAAAPSRSNSEVNAAEDEEAAAAASEDAAAAAFEDAAEPTIAALGAGAPAGDDSESAADRAAAAMVDEEPPALPSASWAVSGDGLHSAMAGQTASFVIESFDATGARRQQGGDKFAVSLTGAAQVRARVFDEGDGRYTCEFRCPSSGKYRLAVQAHSMHLPGSPFSVHVKANSLKEWKAHRAKEAADLREKRKEKERERGAKAEKVRQPSPRINPAEQLAKAYELALQVARGGSKSRSADGSSTTQIL